MPKRKPRHPSLETPDTRAKRQYLREQNRLYSATLQSIPAIHPCRSMAPKLKQTLWYGSKSDRQINEELRSYFDERRHQANQMLETRIREAITLRLGMMPALEELAGRMHRYMASDSRHELIVLDHLPLLHVEWWPQPDSAETSHAMHMLKITPMHPDSPLPFPIQDLLTAS